VAERSEDNVILCFYCGTSEDPKGESASFVRNVKSGYMKSSPTVNQDKTILCVISVGSVTVILYPLLKLSSQCRSLVSFPLILK
jgi:hypothetical protein